MRQLRTAVLAKNIFARVDEVATGANHGVLSEFACINVIWLWQELHAYPLERSFLQARHAFQRG
jgi:hypothetical protein